MERPRPAPEPPREAKGNGVIRRATSAARTLLRSTEVVLVVTAAVACGPTGEPKTTQTTPPAGADFSKECPGGITVGHDAQGRPFTACIRN